jgi:hypothetical protein
MRTPRELRRHSPWSPLSPHRVCCLGELHPVTRHPGHPSIRSFPLCFSRSTLTGPFSAPPQLGRRRPVTSSCPDRFLRVPEPSLKVTNITTPLISPCCPRLCAIARRSDLGSARGLPLHRLPSQSHSYNPSFAIGLIESSPTPLAIQTNPAPLETPVYLVSDSCVAASANRAAPGRSEKMKPLGTRS